MISETKLDDTFLQVLYHLEEFSKSYRPERNSNGSGIIVYIKGDILNFFHT